MTIQTELHECVHKQRANLTQKNRISPLLQKAADKLDEMETLLLKAKSKPIYMRYLDSWERYTYEVY